VAVRNLFVDLFLEAHERAPRQIILDLDATDDPLHGEQEGRFFHGYYDCYCYLPLYVAESDALRTGFRRKPDSVPMIADNYVNPADDPRKSN
jgi:hypothetical protein